MQLCYSKPILWQLCETSKDAANIISGFLKSKDASES
jgi:hypothetical protein